MGQFLAIGLVTKWLIEKEELQEYNISKEMLIKNMKEQIHFDDTIYELSEQESYYILTLKPAILENQLLDFLREFYPVLYINRDSYTRTIKMLENSPPNKWSELSKEESNEEFQFDKYPKSEYIHFDINFRPTIKLDSESIILSVAGKIFMETYGEQFHFFKFCIQKTFEKYLIAKAIRVYITG